VEPVVELSVAAPGAGRGPVTVGVPWPRGVLADPARLVLWDSRGQAVPLQSQATDRWSDASVRWVLLDWIAEAGAGPYTVGIGEAAVPDKPAVRVEDDHGTLTVDTGPAQFEMRGQ
jgi:hypothetical protein